MAAVVVHPGAGFETVVLSCEEGVCKPAPKAFETALRAGFRPGAGVPLAAAQERNPALPHPAGPFDSVAA